MDHPYSSAFFESHRDGAWRSAQVIAPLLIDLVQPHSVVDVGCGTGTWLAVFRECGIEDQLGIDGPYIDRHSLEIPAAWFMAADLTRPVALERTFDLVISVEVAEHLPPESASSFVKSLVALGPVVLFSAAVPGQGGDGHLNEQWPEYWIHLFEEHGYLPADALRPLIWNSADVEPWYAQNALLFVSAAAAAANPRLAAAAAATRREQIAMVHPRMFAEVRRQQQQRLELAVGEGEARSAELRRLTNVATAAGERSRALAAEQWQAARQAQVAHDPAVRARGPADPRPTGADHSVRTILVVSAFPPETAPEANHALHICEQLTKAGRRVHVLCRRGSITPAAAAGEIVTHAVIDDWSWRDLPRVVTCLRDVRPDVVLLIYIGWVYHHHPMITLLPTVCDSVIPGVPCVTQFENVDDFPYPHSFLGRRLRTVMGLWAGRKRLHYVFGTLLRDSTRIILLSSPHRARLLKQDPTVADRTVILPPPPLIRFSQDPPLEARKQVRESLGIGETELVLLYWGYIYPGKGLDTLLEAFHAVCRQYANVRLLIVGGSLDFPTEPVSCADYFTFVRRLPATLGIADRVTWTGAFDWDSDVGSKYLYAADICVLPFDYGVTLNNSTLAAATTHDLPIIGTELPTGEDEGLQHRQNIFLSPPRDAHALAAAIRIVIESPALRLTLRLGASALARDWHRWDRMTGRLLSILDEAVASRRATRASFPRPRQIDEAAGSPQPLGGVSPGPVWSEQNLHDPLDAPLVSVVVAAYNVEHYLSQCLDSLVNQTLANVEVIIVNDASQDGTAAIIEHYRARHANIAVIVCDRNVGLASVRNLGMKAAHGRYIAFLDGDDWADISMCEVLYRRAIEHGSDVVIADTTVFYDDLKVFTKFFDHVLRTTLDPRVWTLPFEVLSFPRVLLVEPVAWTKLYKRAFLHEHHLQFEEGMNSYEDMIFHFSALLKASRVSLIDKRTSFYRQNRPGQISGRSGRKVFEVFDVFARIHDNLTSWEVPAAVWAMLVQVELRQFDWLMKDRVQEGDKREFLALASKQLNRIPEPGFEAFLRQADPDDVPRLFCLRRNWRRAYERVLRLHRGVFPPFFLALNWRRRPDAVAAAVRRNVAMVRHRATAPLRSFAARVLNEAALEEKGGVTPQTPGQPAGLGNASPDGEPVVRSFEIAGRRLLFGATLERSGLAEAVSRMASDHYLSQTAVFRDGDTVVDIGAHVGVFAISLATRYPSLRVYAVEPDPRNYKFLLQNIALNDARNVIAINKAVAAEAGTVTLYGDARDSARSTLDRGLALSYDLVVTAQTETIPLADLFRGHNISHCRLLKITAAGAVRAVLQCLPPERSVDFLCGEVDLRDCSRAELETASRQLARHHFWRTIRHIEGRTDHRWIHQMPRDIEGARHRAAIPAAAFAGER